MRGLRTVARAAKEAGISIESVSFHAEIGDVGEPVGGTYLLTWEDVLWLRVNAKPTHRYKDRGWLEGQMGTKTVNQIAMECGVTGPTIRNWCDRLEVPRPDHRKTRYLQKER